MQAFFLYILSAAFLLGKKKKKVGFSVVYPTESVKSTCKVASHVKCRQTFPDKYL